MSGVRVSEIFAGIQGESTFAGRPCVFVRTAGCNLRCKYCDTTYAYRGGRVMTVEEIMRAVASYGPRLVEVTGGEPLHQESVPALVRSLLDAGYNVLVETNGTYDITVLDERAIRIVDVKCPGSGAEDKVDWASLDHLTSKDQVKFVLSNRTDYAWAKRVIEGRDMAHKMEVLLSPVHGVLDPKTLARWILDDGLPVRLHLQLHKYVWGEGPRGV